MGIIKNLADFLVLLSVPCRVSYLPLLNDLLQAANPLNWRLRQSLASQLSRLMDLLPAQNLFGTLFPLTMALLQDPVYEVRIASYDGVARMIVVLYADPENPIVPPPSSTAEEELDIASDPPTTGGGGKFLSSVARSINALIFNESYKLRQVWAELALRLLRNIPRNLFEIYFIDGLIRLASDPVPVVRVAVAEALTSWEPHDWAPWETEDSILAATAPKPSSPGPVLSRSNSLEGLIKPIPKRSDRPSPWSWLLQREDIKEIVVRLSDDDPDVFLAMQKLQPMFPDIVFHRRSCRGLRVAPGGPSPFPVARKILTLEECEDAKVVPAVDIASTPTHMRRRSRTNSDNLTDEILPSEIAMIDEGASEPAPWYESPKKFAVRDGDIEEIFNLHNDTDANKIRAVIGISGSYDDDDVISPHSPPSVDGAAIAIPDQLARDESNDNSLLPTNLSVQLANADSPDVSLESLSSIDIVLVPALSDLVLDSKEDVSNNTVACNNIETKIDLIDRINQSVGAKIETELSDPEAKSFADSSLELLRNEHSSISKTNEEISSTVIDNPVIQNTQVSQDDAHVANTTEFTTIEAPSVVENAPTSTDIPEVKVDNSDCY